MNEGYLEAGTYFGYPKCCVDFFAQDNNLGEMNKNRVMEMGTLYFMFTSMMCIPCDKCYKVLLRRKDYVDAWFEVKRK